MLYRKRLLSQGNFYLKKNPTDAHLSLEQLQEMARNNSYKVIMHRLSKYAKNVFFFFIIIIHKKNDNTITNI